MLSAIGEHARALAWDHPGYGAAGRPAGFDYTVDGYAQQLDDTMQALDVERAHLVLHDFGGPWGLRWATRYPDRLASVVLVNTGVMIGYRWHTLARIWRAPVIGELFMATTPGWALRRVVNHNEPRPLPREFFDRVLATMDRGHKRAVRRLYRSVDDPAALGAELAAALCALDKPALVIWGRGDAYLPEELAERQRTAFPSARIEMLDGGGHWPMVADPDRVAALIADFVRTPATPARGGPPRSHDARP
ncbi:MAG TPA: alpha/beta hydrolase [Acidimicrobiales bacterium]|nr:alpha/beta hydrolase [Acidimicrobiales bacterium]